MGDKRWRPRFKRNRGARQQGAADRSASADGSIEDDRGPVLVPDASELSRPGQQRHGPLTEQDAGRAPAQQDDLFAEVQRRWGTMEQRFQRMFEDLDMTPAGRPISLGFRVEPGRGGEPRMRPFGDIARELETLRAGWRAPETSIMEDDEGTLHLKADLPGVAKEDIQLCATDHSIEITAESDGRRYRESYHVTQDLDPDSAHADFRNGVLDIAIGRRWHAPTEQARAIRVE